MIIHTLEIEGFRSYTKKQTIDLSKPGLYLLTGDNRDRGVSSAAGKSSIFKAITLALFEKTDDQGVKDAIINTTQPHNGCRIALRISDDVGKMYSIVYSRKHPVEGTDWRVYEWDGSTWVDRREEKLGDTRYVIQNIIGMTYEQFINNAYIAQQRVAEFIESTDEARRAIFAKNLQLNDIDRYVSLAREAVKNLRGEIAFTKGRISTLQSQLSFLPHPNVEKITQQQCQLAQLATGYAALQKEIEESTNIVSALATIIQLNEQKFQLERRVKPLLAIQYNGPTDIDTAVTSLQAQRDLYHTEQLTLTANKNILTEQRNRLRTMGPICSQCTRPVQESFLLDALQEQEVKLLQVEADLNGVTSLIRQYEKDLHKHLLWQDAWREKQRATLQLEPLALELASVEEQISNLREVFGDLVDSPKEVQLNHNILVNRKLVTQNEIAEIQRDIAQYEKNVEDRASLQMSILDEEDQLQAHEQSLLAYQQCETALFGFRTAKIKGSSSAFNLSLAKYLSILTNGEIMAKLVTETPKSSGKGVKAELDIEVTDGTKEGVSIKHYSGGEKTTLSLAITGSFWDLASNQSGGGVNVLLLDEPFGMLDSWQEEQACLLLREMRSTGRTVLVITNRNSLRDRGVFDYEIRAVKSNHASHIEFYDLTNEH